MIATKSFSKHTETRLVFVYLYIYISEKIIAYFFHQRKGSPVMAGSRRIEAICCERLQWRCSAQRSHHALYPTPPLTHCSPHLSIHLGNDRTSGPASIAWRKSSRLHGQEVLGRWGGATFMCRPPLGWSCCRVRGANSDGRSHLISYLTI